MKKEVSRIEILFVGTASLLCVLLSCWYVHAKFKLFSQVQYDDAFITFRYAENLVAGHGLRFNPGDTSNSASSLFFVLVLSAVKIATPLEMPQISNLLNLAGLLALVSVPSMIMVRNLGRVLGGLVSVALATFLGTFPPLLYWAFSGMETVFFLGLACLTCFVGFRFLDQEESLSSWKFRVCALLLFILSITRVEGFLISLSIGGVVTSSRLLRRSAGLQTLGRISLLVVSPVLAFLLQTLFYWWYYESPISDPIKFKNVVGYYQRPASESLTSIETYLFGSLGKIVWLICGLGIVTAAALFSMNRNRPSKFDRKLIWSPLMGFFVVFAVLLGFLARSPFSDEQRYEMVLLVPVIGLLTVLSVHCSALLRSQKRNFSGVIVVCLAAGLLLAATHSSKLSNDINARTQPYLYIQQARADAGRWLEKNSLSGSVVLSSDIGALSYYNPSNIYIDAAGLVNRQHLDSVLKGGDVYASLKRRAPQYIADTVGPDGITGVEQIISSPTGYYLSSTGVTTSCSRVPPLHKSPLGLFPKAIQGGLQVIVASIQWTSC